MHSSQRLRTREPDGIDCCSKYAWAVCITILALTFIPAIIFMLGHTYYVYNDHVAKEEHLREVHQYHDANYCRQIEKIPASKRDYEACDKTGKILRTSPQTDAAHATIRDVFGDLVFHACTNDGSVCYVLFSQLLETIRASWMGAFIMMVFIMATVFACGYYGPYRACIDAKRTRERRSATMPHVYAVPGLTDAFVQPFGVEFEKEKAP